MSPPEIICSEEFSLLLSCRRFIRSWRPKDAKESLASRDIVLGIVHGLGDHCGRYDEMARWFASRGVHVYGFDLVGHGQSPGERMAIRDYHSLLAEVESLFDYLKQRHSDARLGLFGQSMGGNLVLNHQLRDHSRAAFTIAGSPMLRAVNQPGRASTFLLRLLSHLRPNDKLHGDMDASNLSRAPRMQQAFEEDPLVQRGITLRLARVLIDSGRWALENAHRLPTTTLLTHGTDDRITCHQASIEFGERSMGKAVTKLWPNGKHDLHHDIVREDYFQAIFNWIKTLGDS
ncbi:MAG: lysophospholipase [Planctomycetota bacterium]